MSFINQGQAQFGNVPAVLSNEGGNPRGRGRGRGRGRQNQADQQYSHEERGDFGSPHNFQQTTQQDVFTEANNLRFQSTDGQRQRTGPGQFGNFGQQVDNHYGTWQQDVSKPEQSPMSNQTPPVPSMERNGFDSPQHFHNVWNQNDANQSSNASFQAGSVQADMNHQQSQRNNEMSNEFFSPYGGARPKQPGYNGPSSKRENAEVNQFHRNQGGFGTPLNPRFHHDQQNKRGGFGAPASMLNQRFQLDQQNQHSGLGMPSSLRFPDPQTNQGGSGPPSNPRFPHKPQSHRHGGFGAQPNYRHQPNRSMSSSSNTSLNDTSNFHSRGRNPERDDEFDHERDSSPDRRGFQHRGQLGHRGRHMHGEENHQREWSPSRGGFDEMEPNTPTPPNHMDHRHSNTTPGSDSCDWNQSGKVQGHDVGQRGQGQHHNGGQSGHGHNQEGGQRVQDERTELREDTMRSDQEWGSSWNNQRDDGRRNDRRGGRRSDQGQNGRKSNHEANRRRSEGQSWSSPKSPMSDASQSPMSESGTPGKRRLRDRNPMVHLSKTLSFILRHGAEKRGFRLMPGGFLYVDELLELNELQDFSQADVENVVQSNDKQRFAVEKEEGSGRLKIRANQGHSIKVEGLELTPVTDANDIPVVVHGTYMQAWNVIKREGLSRMNRNHIHFAPGEPEDNGVISGMRSSCEVMIFIEAKNAMEDGIQFFRSANNVILSPGDENGYIHPRYFSLALQRVPREVLEFDPNIECSPRKKRNSPPPGPTIPGLVLDTNNSNSGKRKKKKGKRKERDETVSEERKMKKGEKNESVDSLDVIGTSLFQDETGPEVNDNKSSGLPVDSKLQEALGKEAVIEENMPPENWEEEEEVYQDAVESLSQTESTNSADGFQMAQSAPSETVHRQTSIKFEFVAIDSTVSSQSAIEFLKGEQFIAVYCHFQGHQMSDIVIVTEDHAHHFDLNPEFKYMSDGGLAEFLASKQPMKIFHGVSRPSAYLFENYEIILDGTEVYDTQIAMQHLVDTGTGDMTTLAEIGFTANRMDCLTIEGSLDAEKLGMIKDKCLPMLHSYPLFDQWIGKALKKQIYLAVNKDIDTDKLKTLRQLKKKAASQTAKAGEVTPQQQSGGGKKKSKSKRK